MNSITVVTTEGRRIQCAESDRIAIGGSQAEIGVPGDTSRNEYIYIENRQGHPWLIPLTPTILVHVNGAAVKQAMPLRDGDEVRIVDAHFLVKFGNDTLEISDVRTSTKLDSGQTVDAIAASRPRRLRLLKLFLFLTFLLLVAVVLFVFFATPVSLIVRPVPEHIGFRGFPPPLRVQDRYLTLPGNYEVRASKQGYESLIDSVSIERDDFVELEYEMQKLPGRISIYTQPEGASVGLGDETIGATPLLNEKIAAGKHTVRISADRYKTTELNLDVEGMDREQVIRVELAPDWAPVTLRSQPAGANVVIEGDRLGVTPLTVDLLSGRRVVSLDLDRYQPEAVDITVVAGEALAVPVVVLTPTPAKLTVNSTPADATVTVDGKYRGSTPIDLTLTPNESHALILTKPGYVEMEHTVNMQAGEEDTVLLELDAEFGVVFITSNPIDAKLYVDGEHRGQASQRLRLTTRPHNLEFRKSGYKTHRITLSPRAGVSKELSIRLIPENAAVEAPAKAQSIRSGEGQELKLIMPAQFTMGASRREQGRRANENLRRVDLTRPYYLSAKEVTNAEFRRFKPEHSSGSAYGRTLDLDDQPVANVSWEDAVAYLNWLSEKDGLPAAYRKSGEKWGAVSPLGTGYRLPTEAEWANAARFLGAEPKKYAWKGPYPPRGRAENYGDQSAADLLPYSLPAYNDAYAVSAPVGSFVPNEAGFYDLGGNVAEWIHDYYAVYPAQTDTVTKDPIGPSSGRHHVVRGAGWRDSTISELRLSFRDYADAARNDVGFRIARYAD